MTRRNFRTYKVIEEYGYGASRGDAVKISNGDIIELMGDGRAYGKNARAGKHVADRGYMQVLIPEEEGSHIFKLIGYASLCDYDKVIAWYDKNNFFVDEDDE